MKILFALSLIAFSSSAMAAETVPSGECRAEGERAYVLTSETTADVYVCEAGVWRFLFTQDNADSQD